MHRSLPRSLPARLPARLLRPVPTLLAATLLAVLVAVIVTATTPRSHQARADVYFAPTATLDASPQARVASYAGLVDGSHGVRARVVPGSLLVRVTATASDAAVARTRVADAVQRLRTRAASLEPTTRGLTSSVVNAPAASGQESAPWGRNLLTGLVAGLLLGLLAAAAMRRRPHRLVTADDVASVAPLWVTADVPVAGQVSALVRVDDPTERYATLAEGLRYLDVDVEGSTLVVAGSRAGHDAVEVATRLATRLVADGGSVALVDAAFHRPQVAGLLGLDAGHGVVSVLADEVDLADAVQRHEPTGLAVLTAGPYAPDPRSLASSRALHRLLEELRREHTTVLVVADALGESDTAAILATAAADGVLLALREHRDTAEQLLEDVETLEARGARLRGVALTTLAAPPVVHPVAASPVVPEETIAAPALVFPDVVPEIEPETSGAEPAPAEPVAASRIPAQRTPDRHLAEEPTLGSVAQLEPEPEPAESESEERAASLLDDFLVDAGDDLPAELTDEPTDELTDEQPVAVAPVPEPVAASSWSWADDDDTETIWRPRAR